MVTGYPLLTKSDLHAGRLTHLHTSPKFGGPRLSRLGEMAHECLNFEVVAMDTGYPLLKKLDKQTKWGPKLHLPSKFGGPTFSRLGGVSFDRNGLAY